MSKVIVQNYEQNRFVAFITASVVLFIYLIFNMDLSPSLTTEERVMSMLPSSIMVFFGTMAFCMIFIMLLNSLMKNGLSELENEFLYKIDCSINSGNFKIKSNVSTFLFKNEKIKVTLNKDHLSMIQTINLNSNLEQKVNATTCIQDMDRFRNLFCQLLDQVYKETKVSNNDYQKKQKLKEITIKREQL